VYIAVKLLLYLFLSSRKGFIYAKKDFSIVNGCIDLGL